METKLFYEVPTARVMELKSAGIICGSDPQANFAMRNSYDTAEEI